jgi:hypothetical protein
MPVKSGNRDQIIHFQIIRYRTGVKIVRILLPVLLLFPTLSYSQSGYLAGTAQEGIEPDQSLISVHLGGYGAPRDGRFSLHWIPKGSIPVADGAVGLNDRLYVVSNSELLSMNPSGNPEFDSSFLQ